MIDSHCHIDMYSNPLEIAKECENSGILTIGVTSLPSHFEKGFNHLLSFRKVRLALGMHPLYASQHAKEMKSFIRNLSKTSYIGEVGLDFSKEGLPTKELQESSFKAILKELKGKTKILSLHSRGAELEVLRHLREFNIKLAIFHWYTGPVALIDEIVDSGYFFSINPAMLRSSLGRDRIRAMPLDRILTESDGPYIEIQKRIIKPSDIKLTLDYLAVSNGLHFTQVEAIIDGNFKRLIASLI